MGDFRENKSKSFNKKLVYQANILVLCEIKVQNKLMENMSRKD